MHYLTKYFLEICFIINLGFVWLLAQFVAAANEENNDILTTIMVILMFTMIWVGIRIFMALCRKYKKGHDNVK